MNSLGRDVTCCALGHDTASTPTLPTAAGLPVPRHSEIRNSLAKLILVSRACAQLGARHWRLFGTMVGVRRFSRRLIPVLLYVLWTPAAAAQVLTPGERIRVTVPEVRLERLVGKLLRLDQDSLVVESKGRRWTLPRHGVTELETSGDRHRHTWRGALIGGLLVGGFVGQDMLRKPGQCQGSGPYGALCVAVLTGSFLAGAGVGASVGTVIRHDEWIPVSLGSAGLSPPASARRSVRRYGRAFIGPARMSGRPALVAGVTVHF